MSSQHPPAESVDRLPDVSGFRAYATERSYGEEPVELLLPVELQRQLMDERRQRVVEREQARSEKSAAAMATTLHPASSTSTSAPQDESVFINAFERDVARRDRTRRHPVLAAREVLRVASRVGTIREKDYAKRDLELIEKIKARGALRAVANPAFTPKRWAGSLALLREMHPHFDAVTDLVASAVARSGTIREKDYAKRDLELIEKIKARGALRAVANPAFTPKRWAGSLALLREMHPHFDAVTDLVASAVARSTRSRAPLSVPPLHLWGAPGVGKTQYANDLALALTAPVRHHSMENAQTTALLLGTERHWSTASPGLVFDQLVFGDFANPVVVLDELDKAPRGGQYDPLAPLHSLLEPATAGRVRDAALDIEFDASLVIFIATSNDPRKVPAPLLSRFREFEILAPRGEQALQVARQVVAAAVRRQAVPGFVVPGQTLAHQLAHLTPREISQAVQDAVGRAINLGRLHLSVEDFPPELLGVENVRVAFH